MNQVLSQAEILAIVKPPKDSNYEARWPSIKDKEKILEALQNKLDKVVLENGTFNITYTEGIPFKITGESHSTAFLKRADGGFVPCGYFSERELKIELLGQDESSE